MSVFMTWRIVWHRPKGENQLRAKNLSQAKHDAWKVRQSGNGISGCSYDEFVPHWDECPVCGNRGTAPGLVSKPIAMPFSHWQPKKRKSG
jgi:hypothetical protein